MPFFQRKRTHSSGYFGDLLFPVGEELPAGSAVTLWVMTEEDCMILRCGEEDTEIPYLRLISFVADNEPRIREGVSRIPAEVLADVPEESNEHPSHKEQADRMVSARWFGEFQYVDEDGMRQKIYMMERKRSGYYIDATKSLQAIQMEKYFREELDL